MSGPVVIQPDRDGIPAALRERNQWVAWRVEKRDGDPTKLPVDPETGGLASTADPDTWAPFSTTWGYHTGESSSAGVGYVFSEDGPFIGVDLDDCRDPETKQVDAWARDIVTRLDSYTEISPSGTGVHAIVRGGLPDGGNRSGDVEIYDSRRFFTVTGRRLEVNL